MFIEVTIPGVHDTRNKIMVNLAHVDQIVPMKVHKSPEEMGIAGTCTRIWLAGEEDSVDVFESYEDVMVLVRQVYGRVGRANDGAMNPKTVKRNTPPVAPITPPAMSSMASMPPMSSMGMPDLSINLSPISSQIDELIAPATDKSIADKVAGTFATTLEAATKSLNKIAGQHKR